MVFFGQPSVDANEVKPGEDYTFSVTVEVKPELEVSGYKGIEVEYTEPSISDDEIETIVSSQLQSQAILADVEDRPIGNSDMVMIELTLKDGKEVVQEHPGTMVNMAKSPTSAE